MKTAKSWTYPRIEVDEARLRSTIEAVLTRRLGRSASVLSLKREPSPFATLYPADTLAVTLADGGQLSLFLKHLGKEESEHPDKSCFEREIRIYEELLGDSGLPVPWCYGAPWNAETERYELFLEHINGWNLKYQALQHWFTAARRLAHLHAHFRPHAERLRRCGFLLKLDAAYFGGWAERAVSELAGTSAELAARLEPIAAGYGRAAGLILEQPPTLVHNDLSPKNVLADPSSDPARICFIDWEMAGAGCGLLDLVHLKYGLDPDSDRKMCAAYREELAGSGLVPAGDGEFLTLLSACGLQKTLYRVAHHHYWGLTPENVTRLVVEAEKDFQQVA